MKAEISIRDYQPEDVQALANIYYNTIHRINIQHYTEEQVDVWAPKSSVENTEGWAKKFPRTKPIIATVGDKIVGFAEFELNGHIDCFYCHHEWIGKGVGSALKEIFHRAKNNHIHNIFSEVSITAKPFFEKHGFRVVNEQTIVRKGVELTNFKMERKI